MHSKHAYEGGHSSTPGARVLIMLGLWPLAAGFALFGLAALGQDVPRTLTGGGALVLAFLVFVGSLNLGSRPRHVQTPGEARYDGTVESLVATKGWRGLLFGTLDLTVSGRAFVLLAHRIRDRRALEPGSRVSVDYRVGDEHVRWVRRGPEADETSAR